MRHSTARIVSVVAFVFFALTACGGDQTETDASTADTLGSGVADAEAGDSSADGDAGSADAADGGAAQELDGVAAFYQDFLNTYDEARLTGDVTSLAEIAAPTIVAQAQAWHSKNEDALADEAFIGATDLTTTANIVEIIDRSGRTEIVDCAEEREDKQAAASGLPGYHYMDQSAVVSGSEGSWMVDVIDVRADGRPVTGVTCVPTVHEDEIRRFLPRFDAVLDGMVANPDEGLTTEFRDMTNEDLHPILSRALDVYVERGIAPDTSDVEYKYRVVGADTNVDQRIVRVERCAFLPDGERFRSIDTGELVDLSSEGAVSGEITWLRTYYVLFTDAFSDGFEYRLAGVGDEVPDSDCWTSAGFS